MCDWFSSLPFQSIELIEEKLSQDQSLKSITGWNNQTLLHKAILSCKTEVAIVLLKHGADPNTFDGDGRTPVHYSCMKGRLDALVALIQHAGDLTIVDNNGQGCIHHAAASGSVLLLHYLFSVHNLPLNVVDRNQISPLHIVCNQGEVNAFQYLLKYSQVNIDSVDIYGNTLLHLAAKNGSDSLCWNIVSHSSKGAKLLFLKDNSENVPSHYAHAANTFRHRELYSWLRKWEWYHEKCGNAIPPPNFIWFTSLTITAIWFFVTMFLCWMIPSASEGVLGIISFGLLGSTLIRKSHRLNHPAKFPEPAFGGLYIGGFISTVLCYRFHISGALYNVFVLHLLALTAIFCTSYFLLVVFISDPGVVHHSHKFTATKGKFTILNLYMGYIPIHINFKSVTNFLKSFRRKKPPSIEHQVVDIALGSIPQSKFCDICVIVKPDKVRHCKLCDSCCWKLDHHCLFVSNCVAGLNQRSFVLLLIFTLLGNSMFLVTIFNYWTVEFPDMYAAFTTTFHSDLWTFSMVIGNMCALCWAGSMLTYQLHVISFKSSTVQQLKGKYKSRSKITFQERLKNLISFFINGVREESKQEIV